MRRNVVSILGVILLAVWGIIPVSAQQSSTPASGLGDASLPTLEITVTASGYEGIPDSLEAGRYHVLVTAGEDAGESGGGIAFLQPAGMTAEEILAALSGPPGGPDTLPVEGTPADISEEAGGPPPFIYDSTYAGGAYAGPGQTAEVVLDLGPGEWIGWGDDPEAPQEPVVFEVTGEMPADLTEPESSATLSMAEYVIKVTEGELVAGPQVIKIENVGAQPHFIVWGKVPDGTTAEEVQTVLDEDTEAQMTGTPAVYSGLDPEKDLSVVTVTGTQSSGTSLWLPVDVEAGTYVLLCFFPDQGDGMPHANHGMFTVFEVGA